MLCLTMHDLMSNQKYQLVVVTADELSVVSAVLFSTRTLRIVSDENPSGLDVIQ
jgi:hypothetical protein